MTTDQRDEQKTVDVAGKEVEPSYSFSPEVIEARGLSIPWVVGGRLCDAALAKLKEDDGWRSMSYKGLRKLFRDNCADQDGYLSPQAPLLETVVRMLLSAKRDAVSLSEVHRDVADLWITSAWPRHISIESMQRVLDNGVAYGIVRAN
jgi:hypothetical protein